MTPYGYPSESYHCLLDEQPYYLVPNRLIQQPANGEATVNPSCWFSWHGPLPPDKASRVEFSETFCPSDWIVWVEDPGTRTLWPYWVGTEYAEYLSRMAPGQPISEALPDHVRWVLTQANILVNPNHLAARRKAWLDDVLNLSQAFQRGYVAVPGLIHPFHVGALRRYYRYHTRSGSLPFGDTQVSRRYHAHNESVTRFFQYQLTHTISDIARTLLKPSYSYTVAYQAGSELERHTDREQCEFSVTLCIDATPEPPEQSPWPIQLDTSDGNLRVWQYIGDALLYRGRFIPHSRDMLPEGCTSTSLLLHYVDESFDGPLW